MKLTAKLKLFAARSASSLGFHVAWNYQYPPNTLIGLQKKRFATVVDVGANNGQFARATMKHLPDATYYCFEPTLNAFHKLQEWARLKSNVVAVNAALGKDSGLVSMNLHQDHTPSSSILDTTGHSHSLFSFTKLQSKVQVDMITLDEYFGADPVKLRPDVLLKLDVQGYELHVLLGAAKTLEHVHACIVEVCLDPLYQDQSRFDDIFDFLRRYRLHYAGNYDQLYGKDGHVIAMDCVFLRKEQRFTDR